MFPLKFIHNFIRSLQNLICRNNIMSLNNIHNSVSRISKDLNSLSTYIFINRPITRPNFSNTSGFTLNVYNFSIVLDSIYCIVYSVEPSRIITHKSALRRAEHCRPRPVATLYTLEHLRSLSVDCQHFQLENVTDQLIRKMWICQRTHRLIK